MGNGMNKILPGLYLGNFRDAKDAEQLASNNVTHILSIHDNAKPIFDDKSYLCVHASDTPGQNLSQFFRCCTKFIHKARLEGGTVLVHCLAGVSRSVTITVAYIITTTGHNWRDALTAVQQRREVANPNHGFLKQLEDFEKNTLPQEREWFQRTFANSQISEDHRLIEQVLNQHYCDSDSQREVCCASEPETGCSVATYPLNKQEELVESSNWSHKKRGGTVFDDSDGARSSSSRANLKKHRSVHYHVREDNPSQVQCEHNRHPLPITYEEQSPKVYSQEMYLPKSLSIQASKDPAMEEKEQFSDSTVETISDLMPECNITTDSESDQSGQHFVYNKPNGFTTSFNQNFHIASKNTLSPITNMGTLTPLPEKKHVKVQTPMIAKKIDKATSAKMVAEQVINRNPPDRIRTNAPKIPADKFQANRGNVVSKPIAKTVDVAKEKSILREKKATVKKQSVSTDVSSESIAETITDGESSNAKTAVTASTKTSITSVTETSEQTSSSNLSSLESSDSDTSSSAAS